MSCTSVFGSGYRIEPFRETRRSGSQHSQGIRLVGGLACLNRGQARRSNWLGDWQGVSAATRSSKKQSSPQSGHRIVTRMGKQAKNGPFTPLVIVVRNQLGTKQFNQLRGKAISLHSQVIKEFGKQIGAEGKQVQALIRLAKQNGDTLGFLS